MKHLYNTPEIIVEDLEKKDVLCSSGPTADTEMENNSLIKEVWQTMTNWDI